MADPDSPRTADLGDSSSDMVEDTFQRMRAEARKRGRLPVLSAPPRRKARGDMLADRVNMASQTQDVTIPGLGKVTPQRDEGFHGVPRDRAGTRIPDSLLRSRSAKIYRASRRDPQPLGKVLIKEIIERKWNADMARGMVVSKWDEIVGNELASHVTIESFDEGVLKLQASSTAWATQVRLLQSQLLSTIADTVGDGVVNQLKIVGPPAPNWRKGRYYVKGRGPRDTYG
ncbi:DUF721 domain-containing protein [Corynebacterium sputi]|uniref:DUF721 domain-containing protein n=1 Tax=Corynebacterium sputi TaxID=489915 RepID=UPI0004021B00|nr:DciA family protein [Corynebacterium sputi]